MTADAGEAFLFERIEQPRLGGEIEAADFVQQQRAAGGLLEAAGRDCALVFLSEQLRRRVRRRDGGETDLDEGTVLARAVGVQVARRHGLAAATLAGDQHPGVGGGDAFKIFTQLLHRRALAGERGRGFGLAPQAQVLATQLVGFERALDGHQQLAHGQGLFDKVVGAEARGLDRGLD